MPLQTLLVVCAVLGAAASLTGIFWPDYRGDNRADKSERMLEPFTEWMKVRGRVLGTAGVAVTFVVAMAAIFI
jgi:hypothetical protein